MARRLPCVSLMFVFITTIAACLILIRQHRGDSPAALGATGILRAGAQATMGRAAGVPAAAKTERLLKSTSRRLGAGAAGGSGSARAFLYALATGVLTPVERGEHDANGVRAVGGISAA